MMARDTSIRRQAGHATYNRRAMSAITQLPERVAALPEPARARIERLLHIERVTGNCVVPESMAPWVRDTFGSLAAVESQTVVRVVNRWLLEGALYNPLRDKRPVPAHTQPATRTDGFDIFAEPLKTTAADPWGRIQGTHCITTGNISRWDGECAVLIFDTFDPLQVTRAQMRDYLQTAMRWATAAHAHSPAARYFVWMWNGGVKGGASIPHAHAQMGLGRGMHYAKVEAMRRAAVAYRAGHQVSFFDDLLAAHHDLDLTFRAGPLTGFVNIAAIRAKDTWVIGHAVDDALADGLHSALRGLIDRTGTGAFNVALLLPPLFDRAHDAEAWADFPCIARIVDRGAPSMLSSDIGALDVFAHSTVATDPFRIAALLR
jgi:hypothetical protein